MKPRRLFLICASLLVPAGASCAEDWPARPITLIVPFAAGGGVDVSARIQAQAMSARLGQPIVVENMGGASGNDRRASRRQGRPRRLHRAHRQQRNPSLQSIAAQGAALQFDRRFYAGRSWSPSSPRIPIARKDLPVGNLREFVSYTKLNQTQDPDSVRPASARGRICRACCSTRQWGSAVTHVPYRGEGPAQQDLIGGRIDYMCSTIQTGAALAKQNSVRGIAVMSPHSRQNHSGPSHDRRTGLAGSRGQCLECFFPASRRAVVHCRETQQGDERCARRSRSAQASR